MDAEGARLRVVPPPLIFLACLGAGSLLQYLRPVSCGPYSFSAGLAVGVVLLVVAATLGGWALVEMNRHRTPVEPWKSPLRLVTSGPFRFTRNPIYVAFTLILAAIGIMANSAWIAGAAVVLLLLLDRFVIRREEVLLEEMFGSEYASYRSRVRRWV